MTGMASCYIGTFVNVAASQGIKLTKLAVDAECSINFAKSFNIADEPITEGINFQIDAQSDNADKQRLQEIAKMAEERCPVQYDPRNQA
jgi:uncharacterized OsmC-like protein